MPLQDARLLRNSNFALGLGAGNEKGRTIGTEAPPTTNLFGALGVGSASARAAVCGGFWPLT